MLSGFVLASFSTFPIAGGTRDNYVFPPDSKPYGFTLGEWGAKVWQRDFSLPSASATEQDVGLADNSCAINQSGPVWFLEGTGSGGEKNYECTIPAGKAILFPILTGMCSYIDTPNAKSDSELRSCAMSGNEGAIIEVSIDGVRLEDINRYRVQSPPFNLTIPEENAFGILPGATTAVADCWCVMIEPLPVGRHVIQSIVSIPGNPTTGVSALASEVTHNLLIQEQTFEATNPHVISFKDSEDRIIMPISSNSSNVRDFRFNEEMNQVSFRVSSEGDKEGVVMLPVSRALEGPYIVSLDGNVTPNFEVINNQTGDETNIKITYDQGIHEIIITGTNVIPEFPTSLVGVLILGFIIGAVMTLNRMHYLPRS